MSCFSFSGSLRLSFLWYSSRYDLFPRNAHFAAPNYDSCFASVLSEESSPWFWTYPPPLALGSSRHALYGLGRSRGQYNLGVELNYVLFLSQVFSICLFLCIHPAMNFSPGTFWLPPTPPHATACAFSRNAHFAAPNYDSEFSSPGIKVYSLGTKFRSQT